MLVINKIDVTRLEDLTPENRALVQEIIDTENVQCIQVSCYSDEGVMDLKNKACYALLANRVDSKLKGTKINSVINRIHVAQPKARDDVVRAPFIPDVIKERKKYDRDDPDRKKLLRDTELEEGGPGVFNINIKRKLPSVYLMHLLTRYTEDYILANPEWKMDIMPEIMNGKNVADFIDPDIAEKLEALEREEEKLEAEGFYDSDEDIFDSEDEREAVEAKKALGHKIHSQNVKKAMKNQSRLPRTAGLRTLSELTTELKKAGYDPSSIEARAGIIAKAQGAKRKRAEADMDVDMEDGDGDASEGEEGDWMDVDGEEQTPNKRVKSNSGSVIAKHPRAPKSNRQFAGMRDQQVCFIFIWMNNSDILYLASVQGRQATEPRTA